MQKLHGLSFRFLFGVGKIIKSIFFLKKGLLEKHLAKYFEFEALFAYCGLKYVKIEV